MSAVETLPERHRFDVEDVRTMRRMGVLDRFRKTELIDGELFDMAADGPAHRDWSDELGRWLHRHLDERFRVIPSSTLVLSPHNAPMPDWYVYPAEIGTREVTGADVLLVIEQSDTSLAYDLGPKADLYARFGVRDYWVIDITARQVVVHRAPLPPDTASGSGSTMTSPSPPCCFPALRSTPRRSGSVDPVTAPRVMCYT